MLRETELLKRILPDRTEEWRDYGEGICPIHCKEYESHGIKMTFSKVAWLRCIESGKN